MKLYIQSSILTLLTLLHSERPKLYTILAFLSAIGLRSGTHFRTYVNNAGPLQLLQNLASDQDQLCSLSRISVDKCKVGVVWNSFALTIHFSFFFFLTLGGGLIQTEVCLKGLLYLKQATNQIYRKYSKI